MPPDQFYNTIHCFVLVLNVTLKSLSSMSREVAAATAKACCSSRPNNTFICERRPCNAVMPFIPKIKAKLRTHRYRHSRYQVHLHHSRPHTFVKFPTHSHHTDPFCGPSRAQGHVCNALRRTSVHQSFTVHVVNIETVTCLSFAAQRGGWR